MPLHVDVDPEQVRIDWYAKWYRFCRVWFGRTVRWTALRDVASPSGGPVRRRGVCGFSCDVRRGVYEQSEVVVTFHEGLLLVHPFHGPVRIESIGSRVRNDRPAAYLRLVAVGEDLRIDVPVARVRDVGIRPILSSAEVEEVFAELRGPSIKLDRQWSRRMKDLSVLLSTGRLEDLVVIVRELVRRGVSSNVTAEGQMLRSARTRLVAEIALALDGETEATVEGLVVAAATRTG
ncbi:CarD family transcriptional regulator [Amycolatopsis lurida]